MVVKVKDKKEISQQLVVRLTKYVKAMEGKLSQEEIANEIGVSFVQLNRWINHHHEPTGTSVTVLGDFLKRKGF